jgi:hypothetical protein
VQNHGKLTMHLHGMITLSFSKMENILKIVRIEQSFVVEHNKLLNGYPIKGAMWITVIVLEQQL